MFKFFTTKKWLIWSWGGSLSIFMLLWYQVTLDVEINEWFGSFYDMIQKALATPDSVTLTEYFAEIGTFGVIAGKYIATAIFGVYLTSHFVFRWRMSMVEYYHSMFSTARRIEGASQRVQEDTVKFANMMKSLGINMLESVMLLIAFGPILWTTSQGLSIMFFDVWQYGLVVGAIIWATFGTLLLVGLAWLMRLVGVEYDIQKKEAVYRKLLVIAEDDGNIRPKSLNELFDDVRKINYTSYTRYFFFNVGNYGFQQANVLVGYILLAPAIVAGAITLGTLQQIVRAFNKVESSLLYLFKAWPQIIEMASVYKRLREFEKQIKENS